jgi:hypothetical protein
MAKPGESSEEAFVRQSVDSSRRMSHAWQHIGAGGKTFLVFLYVGYALPFIFQVGIFVYVLVAVYPLTTTFDEWLLTLVTLFGFLTVFAFEIRYFWGFLVQLVIPIEDP